MWTREELSDESHSWLRQLPERFHFSEFDITHRKADYSEASPFQSAEERHPGERGRVCFVAHPNTTCVIPSHAIMSLDAMGTYTLDPDTDILISPGAVGRIRKNSPSATFGIFDTEAYSYREVYVPVS